MGKADIIERIKNMLFSSDENRVSSKDGSEYIVYGEIENGVAIELVVDDGAIKPEDSTVVLTSGEEIEIQDGKISSISEYQINDDDLIDVNNDENKIEEEMKDEKDEIKDEEIVDEVKKEDEVVIEAEEEVVDEPKAEEEVADEPEANDEMKELKAQVDELKQMIEGMKAELELGKSGLTELDERFSQFKAEPVSEPKVKVGNDLKSKLAYLRKL